MSINIIDNIAQKVIEEATKRNILIRICGSYGIYRVCKGLQEIEQEKFVQPPINRLFILGWKLPRDIDFVALNQDSDIISELFQNLGFKQNRSLSSPIYRLRNIFNYNKINIDLSFNTLEYNHRIDLQLKNKIINQNETDINRIRLQIGERTIPKTELLLQKLQIVEPGNKDLIDAWWLLKENNVKTLNDENIDDGINTALINYYSEKDWGFYFTIIQNLNRIEEIIAQAYSVSSNEDILNDVVLPKILLLKKIIEDHPKGFAWNFRSKIGTRVRWYNEVDEVYKI